jgi:predicted RecA/RadA family phage recombinase
MAETVYLGDGKNITAYATTAVVAGDLVYINSSDDVVTLSQSSYAATDITAAPVSGAASASIKSPMAVGIALTDAASGASFSIITQGLFIMSGASVTAGSSVTISGGSACLIDHVGSIFGKALTGTSNATGKFCIAGLNFYGG